MAWQGQPIRPVMANNQAPAIGVPVGMHMLPPNMPMQQASNSAFQVQGNMMYHNFMNPQAVMCPQSMPVQEGSPFQGIQRPFYQTGMNRPVQCPQFYQNMVHPANPHAMQHSQLHQNGAPLCNPQPTIMQQHQFQNNAARPSSLLFSASITHKNSQIQLHSEGQEQQTQNTSIPSNASSSEISQGTNSSFGVTTGFMNCPPYNIPSFVGNQMAQPNQHHMHNNNTVQQNQIYQPPPVGPCAPSPMRMPPHTGVGPVNALRPPPTFQNSSTAGRFDQNVQGKVVVNGNRFASQSRKGFSNSGRGRNAADRNFASNRVQNGFTGRTFGRLHCDTCEKTFYDKRQLDAHFQTHLKCSEAGCTFEAMGKVLQEHKVSMHGKTSSLRPMENENEIRRWQEERRRNYPTAANVQRKAEELIAKKTRGELVDEEAQKRKERLKEILSRQAELGCPVAEIPNYYLSNSYGLIQRGGREKRLQDDQSEGMQPAKVAKVGNGVDDAVDERRVCHYFQRRRCRNGSRCHFLHVRQPRQKDSNCQNIGNAKDVLCSKREPTLLSKLLQPEIRRDKSHLLQCFRFFVNNNFLLDWPDKPLKFFSWADVDIDVRNTKADLNTSRVSSVDSGDNISCNSISNDSDSGVEDNEGELQNEAQDETNFFQQDDLAPDDLLKELKHSVSKDARIRIEI